jgi:ACS family hexuronate transporter-like MFS transporter
VNLTPSEAPRDIYSVVLERVLGLVRADAAAGIEHATRWLQLSPDRTLAKPVVMTIPLVVLAAQPLGDISFWVPVLLIGVGASAHQAWSANIFTTVSDMFPNKAIASVVGIGGMAGGIGGVLTTKVGGALFDHYKALGHIETGYTIMFAFCAVAYVIAWSVMKSLVPKFKKIEDL